MGVRKKNVMLSGVTLSGKSVASLPWWVSSCSFNSCKYLEIPNSDVHAAQVCCLLKISPAGFMKTMSELTNFPPFCTGCFVLVAGHGGKHDCEKRQPVISLRNSQELVHEQMFTNRLCEGPVALISDVLSGLCRVIDNLWLVFLRYYQWIRSLAFSYRLYSYIDENHETLQRSDQAGLASALLRNHPLKGQVITASTLQCNLTFNWHVCS